MVIFNLESLNHFVARHKSKMDTVKSIVKVMSKGC